MCALIHAHSHVHMCVRACIHSLSISSLSQSLSLTHNVKRTLLMLQNEALESQETCVVT